MQVFSVQKTMISFKNSCMDKVYPDMLSLLLFRSTPNPREHPLGLCALSASKGTFDDGLVIFGGLKRKNQRESEVKV